MQTQTGQSLENAFAPVLVEELRAAYDEAKRNFYLGGLRLSAVEGGRFCEAAFRMLEQATTGSFTPLSRIDSEKTITKLANAPKNHSVSLRIHIPRSLRVVYDIRNQRNAAHLSDGIDPNLQDATFVVATLDWVMAEFVRLYHGVSANEAAHIIEDLVTRRAPAVQNFEGFLKVLNPKLRASEYALLLLYERGAIGASLEQLLAWVHQKMRKNLKRTLIQLDEEKAFVHLQNGIYRITLAGNREVETRRLHQA